MFAVHIDVEDVLAAAEAGAVDGGLTAADGAGLIGAAINVAKGIGHQGCHLGGVIRGIINRYQVAVVILREVVGKAVLAVALRIAVLV